MIEPSSMIGRLLSAPMCPGWVAWIGLRTARRRMINAVARARLDPESGLVGDRYAGRTGMRQVTLIQGEHLAAIGAYLGEGPVPPARLRRNIVVNGLNLLAVREGLLRVGEALLEVTGLCHPCSRMEEELGVGGYNAVRGHGGLTARVVDGGWVGVGDAVARA